MAERVSGTITPRLRRVALVCVLTMQTVFFGLMLRRPPIIESDNNRYEIAGYNLATGRGIALPVDVTRDKDIHGFVCTRHPDACDPDGTHPTALYPPGYSILVAGVYAVAGRSLWALAVVNYALLIAMFVVWEAMAARFLDRRGYLFALGVACTYPFLARTATLLMSDHAHIAVFVLSLGALTLMRPSVWRGVVFGGLMAFATLTRPYSLLVFPVIWLWPSIWRAAQATTRERLVCALVFAIPFVVWTARNAYWFGRFMPLTTGGPGVLLMHTTLEWEASRYDPADEARFYIKLEESIGGHDHTSYEGDRRLRAKAIERIKANPGKFALVLATHVPKLWISIGTAQGRSRAWPALVLYLGSLLVLGCCGAVIAWRDERWHLFIVAIGAYWLFLLYSPGEARRTLPLRLPMLLLGAHFVSHVIARRRQRA